MSENPLFSGAQGRYDGVPEDTVREIAKVAEQIVSRILVTYPRRDTKAEWERRERAGEGHSFSFTITQIAK